MFITGGTGVWPFVQARDDAGNGFVVSDAKRPAAVIRVINVFDGCKKRCHVYIHNIL